MTASERSAAKGVAQPGKPERLTTYVAHLDCETEAAAIQRGLKDEPGIVEITVYAKASKVELSFAPEVTSAPTLLARLAAMGFPPRRDPSADAVAPPWRNAKVVSAASSGVLLLIAWLIGLAGAPRVVTIGLYLPALAVGGSYFAREALEKLWHERKVGIELLMTVAAIAAAALGQPGEGAMLAFLYSISEAAEGYTEAKTRSAVKALMKLAPKLAIVRRDGGEQEIPAEELKVGEVFLVKPGQAVPTDGAIVEGRSSLDESPITGESVPVEKGPDDTVLAGTLNGEGLLAVRTTKTFADNTLARIIHMVEEAQEKKGQTQQFIEQFGSRYSPAVLVIAVLIAVVGPLALGGAWVGWAARATVFVVAAAPCALVISIPVGLVATLGTAARNGVLIKGGVFVEQLAIITTVALDKTGTLTRGRPSVTAILPLDGSTEEELLALAAAIDAASQHPVAKAIVRGAVERSLKVAPVTEFHSITGAGATALVEGRAHYVVSPEHYRDVLGVALDAEKPRIEALREQGDTVVAVGDGGRIRGLIAVRDELRENARAALQAIRKAGVTRIVMLTGDNETTAQRVARDVGGIDEVRAHLKPGDKAEALKAFAARGEKVAMVGDGVNDAPALAEATVGVAMGAAGTDVALETADVALMSDDLEKLAYALSLARRYKSIARQNIALSIVVVSVLSVGAFLGLFSLPVAVIGHELSELVVIASGLRMLRFRAK